MIPGVDYDRHILQKQSKAFRAAGFTQQLSVSRPMDINTVDIDDLLSMRS